MDEKDDSKIRFEPSVLSFEDEDKIFSSGDLPVVSDTEKEKEDKDKNILNKKIPRKKTIDINHQKLTSNSKIKLFISIILACLTLIFIPFHSVANSYLMTIEKFKLFNSMNNYVTFETLNSSSLKTLFQVFNVFLNKDFMAGYLCLLYTLFHPFIAMKVIYGANILLYSLILMQILYQSRRPSWDQWQVNNKASLNEDIIIECEASFSSPSSSLFIFIFYTIYSLYSYKQFYFLPHTHMNCILKIILFIIFISFVITEHILLLIYKMHYLHEMIFTTCLTLALICLLIGVDYKLQNMFFRATKNLFKIRKNKIKFFLYCFLQLFLAIILFNFTASNLTSYKIEEKIIVSDSCSKAQKEEISLTNTFMDISYIFSMLGTFWGAALTLENPPGEWWYHPSRFYYSELIDNKTQENNGLSSYSLFLLILKGCITIIIFFLLWLIFNFIPYISFIFNFVINCIKYFILFFICTGILPLVYGFFGLNKDKKELNKKIDEFISNKVKIEISSNNLFKSSLFVKCFDRTRIPIIAGNNKIPYIQALSTKELVNPNEDDSFESL